MITENDMYEIYRKVCDWAENYDYFVLIDGEYKILFKNHSNLKENLHIFLIGISDIIIDEKKNYIKYSYEYSKDKYCYIYRHKKIKD